VLHKITKEIFIEDLTLSQLEFEQIMNASSYCERLTFYGCTISTDSECDFSIQEDYQIKYLSFRFTGCSSSWNSKPYRFNYICSGISTCSLKNSLTTLSVHNCKIGKEKAKQMLEYQGITGIDVDEDKNSPLV
jgi:hypothetical protein